MSEDKAPEIFNLHQLPGTWELRAQAAAWWHGVELFFRAKLYDGTLAYLRGVDVQRLTNEQLLEAQPGTFTLSPEAAQVLMDDLWASGVRPSEKRRDGEALQAVRDHLGDMQKVAFLLLGDKLKPKGGQE